MPRSFISILTIAVTVLLFPAIRHSGAQVTTFVPTNLETIVPENVGALTQLAMLEGHTATVQGVAFNDDGTVLATTSNDPRSSEVYLWDLTTGIRHAIPNIERIRQLAFSPDGAIIALAGSYAAESCECVTPLVRLVDVNTRQVLSTLQGQGSQEHLVVNAVFSPDGEHLAASIFYDFAAGIWDMDVVMQASDYLRSGTERITLPGVGFDYIGFAFSPDSSLLAGGDDKAGVMRIWDTNTGEELQTLEGEGDIVWDIAFSSDGLLLASANGKRGEYTNTENTLDDNTVRLWDVMTWNELTTFSHRESVNSVAFSPDNELLVSGTYGGMIQLWSVAPYTQLKELESQCGRINDLSFNSGGTLLAAGCSDNTVRLYGVET